MIPNQLIEYFKFLKDGRIFNNRNKKEQLVKMEINQKNDLNKYKLINKVIQSMKADSISTTATSPISFFRVYFKIHYHTENGKALYLVGDNKQLGNWNPEKGIRL